MSTSSLAFPPPVIVGRRRTLRPIDELWI